MILRITVAIVVCLLGCSPPSNNSEEVTKEKQATTSSEEWQFLFNGDDLSGWEVLGGDANFYVEDGMIVGLTEKGLPNCFLATQGEYDDFVLEVEFKIDSAINSGVQIRSATYERDTTIAYINGKLEEGSRDWEAGRVYGYQVEIDPSERAWTGGFYEEGGRGWLVPLTGQPKAQEAFRAGDWNRFKIRAEGNTFKTWINDVEAVQTTDEQHSKGFIALQLHGAGREEQVGQKVYYRNIRIKEL
ncbi:3-keto-disaccharide hydrolase [Tunicatimonas pelagia]|uniref:3-keto-disaccharide hydrolase n=1 Tax=Tunicatimonas pelagia TaxID=931531 RepID=UPI0026664B44|nr:DUF1080 domain-containing protein [Tunicatimonas pelagia]WKN46114.1 DUF1080 domain-containing protein [Tunicatimonas pelagia]